MIWVLPETVVGCTSLHCCSCRWAFSTGSDYCPVLRHDLTCSRVLFGYICMLQVSKPYRQLVYFWQSTALQ